MKNEFKIPDHWKLSKQQEVVIGTMLDYPGEYICPADFCYALYDEDLPDNAPAPAKLRVLMQRCREIVSDLTGGKARIELRRGMGWRITKASWVLLRKATIEK